MRSSNPRPLARPRRARTLAAAVAGLVGTAGLSACGGPEAPSSPPSSPATGAPTSPLDGVELHTNPAGHVPVALTEAREAGDEEQVEVLEALDQPTATWLAGQHGDVRAFVDGLVSAADEAGEVPVLVLYNIPNRDCRQFSQGGLPDAEAYRAWVGQVAQGLGDREAIVVVEPDAVPHAVLGCEGLGDPAVRYQALADAIGILSEHEGARVYLDAGNASWVEGLDVLVEALRASNLAAADGFSLNVSNFETTEDSAAYGHRLSDAVGGLHFVIDTSRNGAGPLPEDGTGLEWCNPVGRSTGEAPTTDPGIDRVDALLWIKQPGDSDGECDRGEPPAGQFWPEYARDLVT